MWNIDSSQDSCRARTEAESRLVVLPSPPQETHRPDASAKKEEAYFGRGQSTALEVALIGVIAELLAPDMLPVAAKEMKVRAAELMERCLKGGPLPLPGCSCSGSTPLVLRYGEDEDDVCEARIDSNKPDHIAATLVELLELRDATISTLLQLRSNGSATAMTESLLTKAQRCAFIDVESAP